MKSGLLVVAVGLAACTALPAQDWPSRHSRETELNPDANPDGRGNYSLGSPRSFVARRWSGVPGALATGNGINYHNGPVMLGTTHVYYIWYGDWSTDPGAAAILNGLANNIGGSPYFSINTTYTDGSNAPASNSVTLAGSVNDLSTNTSLADADIWTTVVRSFSKGLPVDPNGVYFVLTAPGVAETSGFLTNYCGWHTFTAYNGVPIKYSFVGNAKGSRLGSCAAQTSASPNGDPPADAMASVIAHELEEAVTDPQFNAWYDVNGQENADKCAWTFGTVYAASGGGMANMRLGARDYLIQRNWLNSGGGTCALSYVAAASADFGIAVSPASQSALPGAKTGSYTISVSAANGFAGSVNFAVTGLPAGAALSPAPAASGTVSSFAVQVASTAAAGTYPLTITGTSGSLRHTATAMLVIGANPSFTVSVSPAQQTVKRHNTAQYIATVTPLNGFNSAVTMSVKGLPAHVMYSLSPLTINRQGTTTLKISVGGNTPAGAYTLTITGTSGTKTASGTATLVIQ